MALDNAGRLLLAFVGDETGDAQSRSGVALARRSEQNGWECGGDLVDDHYFPLQPTIVVDGEDSWLAWAGDPDGRSAYVTRQVEGSLRPALSNLGQRQQRRPAMGPGGAGLLIRTRVE